MNNSTLIIVALAVVLAVVVVFLLKRSGKADLPQAGGPEQLSGRRPAGGVAPSRAPAPARTKSQKPEKKADSSITLPVDSADISIEEPRPDVPARPKDVAGVRRGLSAARGGLIARIASIFKGKKEFDPSILEELEEVLLTSDAGVKTTQTILERLRERLDRNELRSADAAWTALREEALAILKLDGGPLALGPKPTVLLMVGVNGVGKTTTIGKLATQLAAKEKSVLLAAGDTFRAAAVQQLEVWAERVGAEIVKGKDGADPGAVAYEATTRAVEANVDCLIVDTAGRLHTKAPLMDEIKKVRKSIGKAREGAPHETWLVVDATTGQNAIQQARLFKEALDLTGIVLTKLDGTAKGGVVLAICDELGIPVRYIGLGEKAEDLRDFDADEFVEALFGEPEKAEAAA